MAQRLNIQGIPRQYQDGFAKIRDMSDEDVRQLLYALDDAPLLMNPAALADRLASSVETIASEDISDMLWSLFSMYSLRDEYEISLSEVAEQIAQAMQESRNEKLRLTSAERGRFEERLVALLNSGKLDLLGKASVLAQDHEHFMWEARILTDIRPIFGSDPSSKPEGAVIAHTLKLTYANNSNQRKEFYVAMDAVDLHNLHKLLQRTEQKTSSLRATLDAAGIPLVDLQ